MSHPDQLDVPAVNAALDLAALTLDELVPCAWHLLEDGARRGRAAFHTPVLASLSPHGPTQRTVVLRHVDAAQRQLVCHTDRRSAKASELAEDAQSSWLFYDRELKLQLRIGGIARIHTDDDMADAAWERSAARSRACYATGHPPGSNVAQPPDAPRFTDDQEHSGRANFAVLSCRVSFLDWLFLCGAGHRRARFVWQDDALASAEWIAP